MLRLILRMYGGEVFTNFIKISERKLAENLKKPEQEIRRKLEYLHKLQVIIYEPQHDSPQLVFTKARQDALNLPLNHKKLDELRDRALHQVKEMGKYVESTNRCRTQLLLAYFNEISDQSCRVCDYCLAQRKKAREEQELQDLREQVLKLLQEKPYLPKELVQQFAPKDAETITILVRELLDLGKLSYNTGGQVHKV